MRLKKNKARKSREAGFTLLETAVASMVMLVGLVGVMQLFVISALYNNSSRQTTIASLVAKKKMEELLAAPLPGIPPAAQPAPLGYSPTAQQVGAANAVAGSGYITNYYIRYRDPNGGNGAMEISEAPFVTGQPPDYIATWIVRPDNVTQVVGGVTVPVYPGMRIITVRAEATKAALKGNGARSANGPAVETATMSTIRTPGNS